MIIKNRQLYHRCRIPKENGVLPQKQSTSVMKINCNIKNPKIREIYSELKTSNTIIKKTKILTMFDIVWYVSLYIFINWIKIICQLRRLLFKIIFILKQWSFAIISSFCQGQSYDQYYLSQAHFRCKYMFVVFLIMEFQKLQAEIINKTENYLKTFKNQSLVQMNVTSEQYKNGAIEFGKWR